MSPNVYAYVTLLQPHAQTKNDLPIRMYGVQGIKIEDPQIGDYARTLGTGQQAEDGQSSAYFRMINRNKQGLQLDLKKPEGVAALLRLVERHASENIRLHF